MWVSSTGSHLETGMVRPAALNLKVVQSALHQSFTSSTAEVLKQKTFQLKLPPKIRS